MQEVEIAPDVHRNLNLAIAALEDLERHRISNVAATAQGKLSLPFCAHPTLYACDICLR